MKEFNYCFIYTGGLTKLHHHIRNDLKEISFNMLRFEAEAH